MTAMEGFCPSGKDAVRVRIDQSTMNMIGSWYTCEHGQWYTLEDARSAHALPTNPVGTALSELEQQASADYYAGVLDDPGVIEGDIVLPERAGREGDSQPLPIPNGEQDIQSRVIEDINKRRELGIKRYGSALQPNNCRDALLDLYEELVDAVMYTRQLLVERDGK